MSVIHKSLWDLWEGFLTSIPQLTIGLIILILVMVFSSIGGRIVKRILARTHLRKMLQDLFRQLFVIAVWIAGILSAAVVVFPNITPAKLLTAMGLGSIAIGFAFKDIFENFFAGILILWRFPFEIDDYIIGDGFEGTVIETTIRMTTVRQPDGQLVTVPNSSLIKSPVRVLTSRDRRRLCATIGVSYRADIEQARSVLQSATESCSYVEGDKPVSILVSELNASSVDFTVFWWSKPSLWQEHLATDQVISACKKALDEAGIEIPFPQRTLSFADGAAESVMEAWAEQRAISSRSQE